MTTRRTLTSFLGFCLLAVGCRPTLTEVEITLEVEGIREKGEDEALVLELLEDPGGGIHHVADRGLSGTLPFGLGLPDLA